MPRSPSYDIDIDREPDYEDALARYVAANPDSPDAGLVRALDGGLSNEEKIRRVNGALSLSQQADAAQLQPPTPPEPPADPALAEGHWLRRLGGAVTSGATGIARSVGQSAIGAMDDPSRHEWWDESGSNTPAAPPPAAESPVSPAPGPPLAAISGTPPPVPARSVSVGRPAQVQVQNALTVQSHAPPVPSGDIPPGAPAGPASSVPPDALARAREVLGPQRERPDPLTLAMSTARGDRLIAGLARAGGTAIGRGTGPGYDALDENADRPLQELGLREAADAKSRAEALSAGPLSAAEQSVYGRLFAQAGVTMDPAMLAKLPAGRVRSLIPDLEKMAASEATRGDKASALERDKARDSETARHNRATEDLKAHKGGAGAGGKILPSTETAKIGDFDSATKMVDQLMVTRGEKVGRFSGVAQYLPGTDAAQYSDAADTTAQAVGIILEGGKLSDADLPRYRRMLPTAGDGDDRAKAKAENIKQAMAAKKAGQLDAFGKAGYRVIDLLEKGQIPAPHAAGTTEGGDDADAVAWAHAHPGDPKAKRILELNRGAP